MVAEGCGCVRAARLTSYKKVALHWHGGYSRGDLLADLWTGEIQGRKRPLVAREIAGFQGHRPTARLERRISRRRPRRAGHVTATGERYATGKEGGIGGIRS